MRLWREAERSGFEPERCRRVGVHAQAARQVAPLFEQFLRIATEEDLDTGDKPFDKAAVQRCLLVAFPDHLAKRLEARRSVVAGMGGVARWRVKALSAALRIAEIRESKAAAAGSQLTSFNLATAVGE
jgi:ATP-dependent helicase HrpB